MAYFVRLPEIPTKIREQFGSECDHPKYANIINGISTIDQRELRRSGYAEIEPDTVSTFLNICSSLLSKKNKITIFDVGSNSGMYSIAASGLFSKKVVIHAFEPAPDSFHWLCSISSVNNYNIHAHEIALSNTTGKAKLYISQKSDASNSLESNFRTHKNIITIDTDTIDNFVDKKNIQPDLLKIDAETYDLQVLEGGKNLIAATRPFIICEVLNTESNDYGTLITEFMKKIGGYHFYFINKFGELKKSEIITGDSQSLLRDWLLTPTELTEDEIEMNYKWREKISNCKSDYNYSHAINDKLKERSFFNLKKTLNKILKLR